MNVKGTRINRPDTANQIMKPAQLKLVTAGDVSCFSLFDADKPICGQNAVVPRCYAVSEEQYVEH